MKIDKVLKGVSRFDEFNKSILILVDTNDSYYSYVSNYESGQEVISGGMFIRNPVPHFIARNEDLYILEATLIHELTHSALNHFSLPLWVDEGLAVNTERRLVSTSAPIFKPEVIRRKHREFWDEETIQDFWSGRSFHINGDSMALSYELARSLIQHLSQDWELFKQFVADSRYEDAAEQAVKQNFSIDLGALVSVFIEKDGDFSPKPKVWT